MSQSKRELREQRKAAREAQERAEAVANTRRRRTLRLGGAVVVAAVVVAIAAAVSASGGSKSPTVPATTAGGAKLVAGIPERDGVLGNPNAPITVTEYLDLQCPICKEASTSALPGLIKNSVRTGKVKLQARTLSFIGPDSVTAAKVAAGARQQGKLWAFLETFYASQGTENSGYVTDGFLRSVAKAAGVDAGKALAAADGEPAMRRLEQADADATRLGVNSTPTFTVEKAGGQPRVIGSGVLSHAALAKALR